MQTKKSINCNKQEILQSLYDEDSMLFMRNLIESENILVLVTEFLLHRTGCGLNLWYILCCKKMNSFSSPPVMRVCSKSFCISNTKSTPCKQAGNEWQNLSLLKGLSSRYITSHGRGGRGVSAFQALISMLWLSAGSSSLVLNHSCKPISISPYLSPVESLPHCVWL